MLKEFLQKVTFRKENAQVTMDKSIPLNLDLTCLEINSSLEDSLATASSILSLVKTVEPNIITIQCLITEESLDYLLFKKLPANNYAKKFTKSSDTNKQANSCVAWKVILTSHHCNS